MPKIGFEPTKTRVLNERCLPDCITWAKCRKQDSNLQKSVSRTDMSSKLHHSGKYRERDSNSHNCGSKPQMFTSYIIPAYFPIFLLSMQRRVRESNPQDSYVRPLSRRFSSPIDLTLPISPGGLKPPTFCFVGRRSVQLSYGDLQIFKERRRRDSNAQEIFHSYWFSGPVPHPAGSPPKEQRVRFELTK